MNDLLRAIWQKPDAAFNHLRSYGQLASVETDMLWQAWQKRALLLLGAVAFGSLTLMFSGMVVMAWALTETVWTTRQWLGLCAPASLSAIGTILCLLARSQHAMPQAWASLKAQWQLDTQQLNTPAQANP